MILFFLRWFILGVYKRHIADTSIDFPGANGGLLYISWEWGGDYVYTFQLVSSGNNVVFHEISSSGSWGSLTSDGTTITYTAPGNGREMTVIYIHR